MLFGGILDDEQTMSARQLDHRVHVDRQAINMNHHDGLGTVCDLGGEQVWVEIPGIRLTIDHYGSGPRAHNRRGAGNNSEARQNYLISRRRSFRAASATSMATLPLHTATPCAQPISFANSGFELFDEWTFRRNPARLDALRRDTSSRCHREVGG